MAKLQCSSEPSCKCLMDSDGLYADCSHQNLTESPIFSPDVKIVNLSHNKLKCLPSRERIPDGLVHLDLSYNFTYTLSGDSFQGLRNLTILLLQHNKLRKHNHTEGIFEDLRNIQILDLSYNINLTSKILRSLSFDLQNTSIRILLLNKIHCAFGMGTKILVEDVEFLNYTKLKELHLDSNRIEMFEKTAICYLPKTIEFVSVSDNKFSFGKYVYDDNAFYVWDGPVHGLDCINVVNLSNNFCSYVSEHFFQYAGSSTELYLRNNILGFSLARDIGGLIFRNLNKLEILDLQENRISTLPKAAFQGLIYLKYLDLSNNFLKSWDIDTTHMRSVNFIDLSGNEITSLSGEYMKDFDRLGTANTLTLNLLKNSFMCNCRTITFMKWMAERNKIKKITFLNFEDYNCTKNTEHGGEILKFDEIERHIFDLQRECRSYTAIIFVTTGTFVCFLIILCTGIVYRYRWKLRYFYYMTKSRYHEYKSVRSENLPLNQYDAFVSYADEDRVFVLRLIKELEEEAGLKLCIHQRDFVPGFDIAENIITAVNKSRKTIILLSPNFIKSSWCMYELHIAKMEEIYSRNEENVISLILYETMPLQDIPLTLMDLINQKTYIEFPNDDQEFGEDVFWSTLKESFR
ncbi:toll-like receptor 4 [Saccostrea echinata]|uniref:toll-like receptor 4 n=1 Tax=Saccostrea echinata TaxID=191078 RepID=UPI002A82F23C|nr:toll-like receptor 4 [Saccostrea echinata]